MSSVLSNYFGNQILAHYLIASPSWLALHSVDPTVLGDAASEVAGGDYARQRASWSAPGSKTVASTTALTFVGMPAATVTYLGVWDAASGGNLLVTVPLGGDGVEVAESGHFLVAAGDVAITV